MTTPQIKWISRDDPPEAFPDVRLALAVPNGLLAAGGDLGTERLLTAYERTIFPWYDEGQPILWWSPDPRCVLVPDEFHVSRSLRRRLRRGRFVVTCNRAFESVIRACGAPRRGQAGTWITPEMIEAFCRLHREHWAHSVEVWEDDRLVGGIYGLAIGRAFFGESMFSRVTDASKTAMLALCRHLSAHAFTVLDCQLVSPHLLSLGARPMPRAEFKALVERACRPRTPFRDWPAEPRPAAELVAG
ncbi:MAG TPA: leucyl/phenylalanyl-tRNA--protein transferase [Woeseiaceae bacterium]|nr:leucyl/phenylalanyl-tRNA--protein transferase [Woeseiaceae bacterium]